LLKTISRIPRSTAVISHICSTNQMTPSIAALLGKWFWWPQHVRPRPVPAPWPKPIQAQPQEAVF
jgi:uncharacterized membrane protein YdfJ with MMPL/SSD domain